MPHLEERIIVHIHPDSLVRDIAPVLDRWQEWAELSARSRRYVEKWHDPSTIAAAMVDAYRNPGAPFGLLDRGRVEAA